MTNRPTDVADADRELAREWYSTHRSVNATGRVSDAIDDLAELVAAGREAEREAWLAGLVRATGRTEQSDRFAVPSPDGNAPETWPTLELAEESAERLYRKESTP